MLDEFGRIPQSTRANAERNSTPFQAAQKRLTRGGDSVDNAASGRSDLGPVSISERIMLKSHEFTNRGSSRRSRPRVLRDRASALQWPSGWLYRAISGIQTITTDAHVQKNVACTRSTLTI